MTTKLTKKIAVITMRCSVDAYNDWARITRSDAFTSVDTNGKQSRMPAGHILSKLIKHYEATVSAARDQSHPVKDYVRGEEYTFPDRPRAAIIPVDERATEELEALLLPGKKPAHPIEPRLTDDEFAAELSRVMGGA